MNLKTAFVFMRQRPTAGVTGKGGIWRTKPPDAESAVGAESPKVWATPALVRCTRWARVI